MLTKINVFLNFSSIETNFDCNSDYIVSEIVVQPVPKPGFVGGKVDLNCTIFSREEGNLEIQYYLHTHSQMCL